MKTDCSIFFLSSSTTMSLNSSGSGTITTTTTCTAKCPEGFYENVKEDGFASCMMCDSMCKSCFNLSTNCTRCQGSLFLMMGVDAILAKNVGKCVIDCGTRFWGNSADRLCSQCEVGGCLDCANGLKTCRLCEDGLWLKADVNTLF